MRGGRTELSDEAFELRSEEHSPAVIHSGYQFLPINFSSGALANPVNEFGKPALHGGRFLENVRK